MMDISKFTNITNPIFSNDSGNYINFTCDIDGVGTGIQFTASDTDPEDYGHQLYVNAVNGAYGTVAPYIPVEETPVLLGVARDMELVIKNTMFDAFKLQCLVDSGKATTEQMKELSDLKEKVASLI